MDGIMVYAGLTMAAACSYRHTALQNNNRTHISNQKRNQNLGKNEYLRLMGPAPWSTTALCVPFLFLNSEMVLM